MTEHQQELKKLAKQQEYALQLEKVKWQQRKQELAFLEAGQHMRALNQLMWQVPNIAMAITGGLWYGAANVHTDGPRAWVFAFAALADCMTVITLWRLRYLIELEIGKQKQFESLIFDQRVKVVFPSWILDCATTVFGKENIVVKCWTVVLLAAAAVGVLGALNTDKFSATSTPQVTHQHPAKPTQSNTQVHKMTSAPIASSPVGKKSP